jgi:glyoxylase-like metal-dependent hydrolase (beta-lactamase superfamily II)
VDHVWDAARIQREQGCAVYYHPETAPMIQDRNFYRRFGMPWDVEPVEPGVEIREQPAWEVEGVVFRVLEVPGHCPGSLCFLQESSGVLFGGDVLFRGGVGRWDLPGGNRDVLLDGIRQKVMALPDAVRVLPGHGPATTVGIERSENPYVRGDF